MSKIKEELKALKGKTTPLEHANELVECLDSFYTEDLGKGVKMLPEELSKYAGIISVAYEQAKSLQAKLEMENETYSTRISNTRKNMNKLDLDGLLKMKSNERNNDIFHMFNNMENVGLFGSEIARGILIEKNFEAVLKISDVNLVATNNDVAIMIQNGKTYAADVKYAASCFPDEDDDVDDKEEKGCYVDFGTLREIASLGKTYIGALSIGGIISMIYTGTTPESIETEMVRSYSKEDFDPATDDGRIFNAYSTEIKSCYSEVIE